MSQFYEMTLPIDSRDVDGNGFCKASALLGHLQEAATQAAEYNGFSRERIMERYHAFWMLTRVWYQLKRPLRWEEKLTIRTWHRKARGASLYRDYDLLVGDEVVGECVSIWVLTDVEHRKLLNLGNVAELEGGDGGILGKERKLLKIRLPQEMRTVDRRLLRYSDTDINGHVNNTRYADFACDAIHLEGIDEGHFLCSMHIDYMAECHPGERLNLEMGQVEETYFLHGMDEGGKSRFEATLIFGKVLS